MEEKKFNKKIKIYFTKTYFYLGEYIKGNIEIITEKVSIVSEILIEIFVIESWKVKEKTDEEPKKMNNKKRIVKFLPYLYKIKNFKITDAGLILPKGKNLIPFDFRFSEENNPVFEYPLPSKRAYIRYQFTATVETSLGKYNSSLFLCLISRPIINEDKILSKSVNMRIKKWKIFGKGETIFKVMLPENNFKYDSKCKVTIDIDNTKLKANTKEYRIKFIRKIIFKDNMGNTKYTDECFIIRDSKPAVVNMGQTGQFEYELTFKEKNIYRYNYTDELNPYNNQLENINFFMPTVHGTIISCDYEIKVTLYFDCFVAYADRPRIILPIYLVHQSPMDYQLEIQEQIEYENALQKSIDQSKKEKIEKEKRKKENKINNLIDNKIPLNVNKNINLIDNKIPINDNNNIKNYEDNYNLIDNKIPINVNNNIKNKDNNYNLIDNKLIMNNIIENKIEKNNNIIGNKEKINNNNLKDNKNEIKKNNNNLNVKKEIAQNNIENESNEDDEDEEDDDNVPSFAFINKAKEEKRKKQLNQMNNKNDKYPLSNSQKNFPLPSKEINEPKLNNNNLENEKQKEGEGFSLFD